VNDKIVKLKVFLTKDFMPDPHRLVLVSGGVAVWTGSVWLSKTGDDSGRVIEWPVKWWCSLLHDSDIVDEEKVTNDAGPAFPQTDLSAYGMGPTPGNQSGMSLFEYYLGQSLNGLLCGKYRSHYDDAQLVKIAAHFADLMVEKALERRKGN